MSENYKKSHILEIEHGNQYVGQFRFDPKTKLVSINYAPEWLKNGFPLSPHIPLTEHTDSFSVKTFLENLLPEGEMRQLLLGKFRLKQFDLFEVLKILGRDIFGGVSFRAPNAKGRPPKPIVFALDELNAPIEKEMGVHSIFWKNDWVSGLSGSQVKIPIILQEDGDFRFPDSENISTHILKFQPDDEHRPHLALNEFLCMRLGKMIGLDVAPVDLMQIGQRPVLLLTRFDRIKGDDGEIIRKHAIDGCQALNIRPQYKKEKNLGSWHEVNHVRLGLKLAELFKFTEQCRVPTQAKLKTLIWVLYNLCISNYEGHGKKISYLITKKGVDLAPLYSLVNFEVYPYHDHELALSIGNEFIAANIKADHLILLCRDCGIPIRVLKNQLMTITKDIISKLSVLEEEIPTEMPLNKDEKAFIKGLLDNIKGHCLHFASCANNL